MKHFIITLFTAAIALTAMAQSNIELGKKWYDLERYDKALPYLIKAVNAGDPDSKARLATMIWTMEVPEYSLDRDRATQLLDEAIEAGSVLALERKAFCTIIMGDDTPQAKQEAIDLYTRASDAGNSDASYVLFKIYRDGLNTVGTHEQIVAPSEERSLQYLNTAFEQGGVEGKAYVGLYTYEGSHGYERDTTAGAALMEQALDAGTKLMAANCIEPSKAIIAHLKAHGRAAKAAPLETLLRKYHPTK